MSRPDGHRAAVTSAPQPTAPNSGRGVTVRPFRALLYDRRRVPDVSAVLAPPYDAIDRAEKQLLLERHRYNCVRLVLPQPPTGEPEGSKYTYAGRQLRCWLCQGVLRELEEPAFFVLREEFELGSRGYRRTSFLAAVAVEALGQGPIYPHEETMGEARRDRLALLEATWANLSLVMTFCLDRLPRTEEEGEVAAVLEEGSGGQPFLQATGPQGVRLTLWAVTDGNLMARLSAAMERRELFIADGHHRYETALAFARSRGALGSEDPQGAGFVPVQCIPMEDPGLLALPTHRLFPAELGVREGEFLERARGTFDVEEVRPTGVGLERLREVMRRRGDEHAFGLYGAGRRAYLLTLGDETVLDAAGSPYDRETRRLDVCVFQEQIVRELFGLDFSLAAKDGTLRFTHTFSEAQQRVETGEISLAFLVNPTPVAAIPGVARRGGILPPKSTYFYPKVPAGLLFRLIH